ncbi:MAG: hypothetical protein AAGJ74_04225 [Pseudomonadota bacterium]
MDWVHRAVFLLAAISLVAALSVVGAERSSARLAERPAERWYLAPTSEEPKAVSAEAQFGVLISCSNAITSPTARMMPQERRRTVSNACLGIANRALAASPGFGAAHLVRAGALAGLGAFDDAAAALTQSAELAPHLDWMALHRLAVARQIGVGTGTYPAMTMAADLEQVLRSDRGSQAVAAFYSAHKDLQEPLISILETLPSDAQTEFLQALRAQDARRAR